ncbi:MAG: c-type cytochrome, partial [Planctomycetota bacterium]
AASSVFDKSQSAAPRADIIERYQSINQLAGELDKGKVVFTKQCGRCHRLAGTGNNVGPDLASLSDKSTSAMLLAILAPNQSVEDKYLEYYLLDADGRQFTGIISSETSNSVTLTMADGNERQVLRTEIDELRCTGRSLMPVGLEQEIPEQDMADLLAFIRSVSVPRKQFPGNTPQIAPVRDDGSIRLFAIHASIYGPSVELEPRYKNLGMWSNRDDRAVWKLKVAKAGRYSVNLDYACSSQCSGNRLRLVFNGNTFSAKIPTTGSWDNYSWKRVGTIELPKGDVEVTLKSDGDINQYLGDFRTIILEPRD